MPAFLIAHTASNGTNIAVATVPAKTEAAARARFEALYPDRVILQPIYERGGQREGRGL